MGIKQGVIELQDRIKWKDSGEYESQTVHPAVLPIASDYPTGIVYYLPITSNIGHLLNHPDEYYSLIDTWAQVGLRTESLVKIDVLYKTNRPGKTVAGMPRPIYKDMMQSFVKLQERMIEEGR